MAWIIEYRPAALKALKQMDRALQLEILSYIHERIAVSDNPQAFGKPLSRTKHGLWRYRLRDYRIICQIQKERLVVLVVTIGHRKNVYD